MLFKQSTNFNCRGGFRGGALGAEAPPPSKILKVESF